MEYKKLIEDHEYKINKDSFSLRKLKHLYSKPYRGFCSETGKLKDFTDAKKYISSYLFPVENGYVLNSNGVLEFKNHDVINRTYIKRLAGDEYKELKTWFNSTDDIYRRVCIPNRQLIKDDTLNMVGAFLHEIDMKYKDCKKEHRRGVKMMLNFIKTVWCSDDEEQYQYIINWIANMCQGNKNEMLLYAKSHTEGIGKSTLTEFLMDYVIGRNLTIQPSSDVLTTGNNNCLFGRLLVCFEELKSSKAEWSKMSSCLKEWITSDTITYSEKYMIGYTAKNINNYIINTNTEAIKGAGGRRYYACELSTKYKGDHDFWDTLYTTCFNNDVGKAFYLYMIEKDIKGFKSNNPPTTKRKKEYITNQLSSTYKFLKFNYLLCDKDIKKVSTKDLYEQYCLYCDNTENIKHKKTTFHTHIRELGFDYKTSNSKSLWNITNEELKTVAVRRGWAHELDNDELQDNVIWGDLKTVSETASKNNLFFNAKHYEDIIDAKDREIEELKKQLAELQKPKTKKTKSPKTKKEKTKSPKTKKEKTPKKQNKIIIDPSNSLLSAFVDI